MSQKLKKPGTEGFTIIEVMIVLAIAGLILLIVFLAVPALQRNSRNTQRKNDVQSALGAVSEFESNNSGAMPTAYSAGPPTQLTGGAGTTSAGLKLGYYTTITFAAGAQGALTTDTLQLVTGAVCSGGATTTTGASARSIAAQYEVEGGAGLTATCQNS